MKALSISPARSRSARSPDLPKRRLRPTVPARKDPVSTLGQNREMGRIMLGIIKNDIKKNYYDPTFHGIDIDAKFNQTDEKIKQASSLNEVLGLIAAAVMALNVFDHDIKVGELKRRSETKPLVAKSRGKESFTGKLVVLIDSRSSSAAEIFARTIQTEKRGIVIGDRSAGLVMRCKTYEPSVRTKPAGLLRNGGHRCRPHQSGREESRARRSHPG
jgi:hypothetical protein